jgi:hypothetical protein
MHRMVSVSPRNDATVQQACATATTAEIVTLAGVYELSEDSFFRIRTADVQAAVARGAVFEIPYAKAILCKNQRNALIQVSRERQAATLGTKVILSSGAIIYAVFQGFQVIQLRLSCA